MPDSTRGIVDSIRQSGGTTFRDPDEADAPAISAELLTILQEEKARLLIRERLMHFSIEVSWPLRTNIRN